MTIRVVWVRLNTVIVDVMIVFLDDICQKLLAVTSVTLDG